MAAETLIIRDTKFIFTTNFSGDPNRDTFGSSARKANIIIPTEEQANDISALGVNVKCTKPRPGFEDEYEPTYFVPIKVNYDSKWPPNIYMVTPGAEPVLLDINTVNLLDNVYVTNVNAELNVYRNEMRGTVSLYVKTMYVEQEPNDDPFASAYRMGTELPF